MALGRATQVIDLSVSSDEDPQPNLKESTQNLRPRITKTTHSSSASPRPRPTNVETIDLTGVTAVKEPIHRLDARLIPTDPDMITVSGSRSMAATSQPKRATSSAYTIAMNADAVVVGLYDSNRTSGGAKNVVPAKERVAYADRMPKTRNGAG
jgi:hypothetical protein